MLKSNALFVHEKNELIYISFPKLDSAQGVTALFTTRMGGVSKGQYARMNMSTTNGDDIDSVKKL